MGRIEDKRKEIEKYLEELRAIVPKTIEEYATNIEKKAACERYIEKIVEAAIDLAFLIIKSNKLRIPEDDGDAFTILSENNIIASSLATKLRNAKGMKNIIAHQYGKIDDEIIFEALSGQLEKDVMEFIESIKEKK